jgi:glycosyltransferase involved in cell wall biosynthesis
MFSALPIVAYDMGGIKDGIWDGENGYLIEPDNTNDFKQKVMQILDDDKLRQGMAENSLNKAYEYFTLKHMLNEYEKVIKEVFA